MFFCLKDVVKEQYDRDKKSEKMMLSRSEKSKKVVHIVARQFRSELGLMIGILSNVYQHVASVILT